MLGLSTDFLKSSAAAGNITSSLFKMDNKIFTSLYLCAGFGMPAFPYVRVGTEGYMKPTVREVQVHAVLRKQSELEALSFQVVHLFIPFS